MKMGVASDKGIRFSCLERIEEMTKGGMIELLDAVRLTMCSWLDSCKTVKKAATFANMAHNVDVK